jgi:hypothetical protein
MLKKVHYKKKFASYAAFLLKDNDTSESSEVNDICRLNISRRAEGRDQHVGCRRRLGQRTYVRTYGWRVQSTKAGTRARGGVAHGGGRSCRSVIGDGRSRSRSSRAGEDSKIRCLSSTAWRETRGSTNEPRRTHAGAAARSIPRRRAPPAANRAVVVEPRANTASSVG